jgi:hypothetical protein
MFCCPVQVLIGSPLLLLLLLAAAAELCVRMLNGALCL